MTLFFDRHKSSWCWCEPPIELIIYMFVLYECLLSFFFLHIIFILFSHCGESFSFLYSYIMIGQRTNKKNFFFLKYKIFKKKWIVNNRFKALFGLIVFTGFIFFLDTQYSSLLCVCVCLFLSSSFSVFFLQMIFCYDTISFSQQCCCFIFSLYLSLYLV